MYDLEKRDGSAIADLRSDTVTKPSDAMRAAMASAEVGDDVYREDPTVARLEAFAAEMLGREEALFAPSGTQTNLLGVLCHCERGDEVLIGRKNHIYRYEARGASVLGGVTLSPLPAAPNGAIAPDDVTAAIHPDDPHFPISQLLCLENTHDGRVQTIDEMSLAIGAARTGGLGAHLDGARMFNACVALGVSPAEIAASFDTVSICLSKGLGAPVGSVLVGDHEMIAQARRLRKMLGGGMRQVGIIAAAGLYALEHNIERLAEDHARARRIAERLAEVDGVSVDLKGVQTNMIFAEVSPQDAAALKAFAARKGVTLASGPTIRLVTHLDLDDAGEAATIAAFEEFFAQPEAQRRGN